MMDRRSYKRLGSSLARGVLFGTKQNALNQAVLFRGSVGVQGKTCLLRGFGANFQRVEMLAKMVCGKYKCPKLSG